MAATFLDIAITPDVMDVQHEMGSDSLWQTPRSRRQADRFGDSEAGMIATRDSFYLATVSQSGWPYIQHRGGRACLFLMDYPRRARLKIYATVEVLAAEDHPQLLAQVAPANYRARIERLFLFHLQAFDWNCPQHITPRYSAQQVAEYSQNLQQRIHDLEQENQRLQQQLARRGE